MVNSIFKTYEVTVDTMKDSSVPQNMRYSQNDLKSAKILINVNHDGNEEDFSEAIAVRVSFEKSDKKIVYQDCQPINVMKGKYQVLLTTQTLTSVGIVTAHIHIYFPNDKKVETGSFTFEVVESKMSDEVIESTDSFTVIQKAIEVGEKFQNVDFNPILAAGALAQGALPKSGGTMTGNVDMDISVGAKSKGYRWKDASGTLYGIESATDGKLICYDYKSAVRVWEYDPVTKRFNVNVAGNVLKTTGDTMTGHLYFEKDKGLYFKNADTGAATTLYSDANGTILRDLLGNTNVWTYNYASKTFTLSSGVTSNIMRNTGDTMTGDLSMEMGAGASRKIAFRKPGGTLLSEIFSNEQVFTLRHNDGTSVNDVLKYSYDTKKFDVLTPNTNLVTKTKDGSPTLTLTADATNPDTAVPPTATRRGNSVTFRGSLRRTSATSNAVLLTLPVDMRPATNIYQGVIATDGTYARLIISVGGVVQLENSSANKDFYIACTYVVD
ncbi:MULTISPECIES: phage baseplate upper protein [Bacillus]|nr:MULTISPECIES: phage baseplate upper protein [Bacillus]